MWAVPPLAQRPPAMGLSLGAGARAGTGRDAAPEPPLLLRQEVLPAERRAHVYSRQKEVRQLCSAVQCCCSLALPLTTLTSGRCCSLRARRSGPPAVARRWKVDMRQSLSLLTSVLLFALAGRSCAFWLIAGEGRPVSGCSDHETPDAAEPKEGRNLTLIALPTFPFIQSLQLYQTWFDSGESPVRTANLHGIPHRIGAISNAPA